MDRDNKYYSMIENMVRNHRKFPGHEAILDEIIDDVYAHSEVIITSINDENVIRSYLEKVISTSIIVVPKRLNYTHGAVHRVISKESVIKENPISVVPHKELESTEILDSDSKTISESVEPISSTSDSIPVVEKADPQLVDRMINIMNSDSIKEDSEDIQPLDEELSNFLDIDTADNISASEDEITGMVDDVSDNLEEIDISIEEDDDDDTDDVEGEFSAHSTEDADMELVISDSDDLVQDEYESVEIASEPDEEVSDVALEESSADLMLEVDESDELSIEDENEPEEFAELTEEDSQEIEPVDTELELSAAPLDEEVSDVALEESTSDLMLEPDESDELSIEDENEPEEFAESAEEDSQEIEPVEAEPDLSAAPLDEEVSDVALEESTSDLMLEADESDELSIEDENEPEEFAELTEEDSQEIEPVEAEPDLSAQELAEEVTEVALEESSDDLMSETENGLENSFDNIDDMSLSDIGEVLPVDDLEQSNPGLELQDADIADLEENAELGSDDLMQEQSDELEASDESESLNLSDDYFDNIKLTSSTETAKESIEYKKMDYSVFDFEADELKNSSDTELLSKKLYDLCSNQRNALSIFDLRYKQNYSVEKIAEELNITKEDVITVLNKLVELV